MGRLAALALLDGLWRSALGRFHQHLPGAAVDHYPVARSGIMNGNTTFAIVAVAIILLIALVLLGAPIEGVP